MHLFDPVVISGVASPRTGGAKVNTRWNFSSWTLSPYSALQVTMPLWWMSFPSSMVKPTLLSKVMRASSRSTKSPVWPRSVSCTSGCVGLEIMSCHEYDG